MFKHLAVRALDLGARSGSGNCSRKYLMSVSFCSDKKGQVLRHGLPSRVQFWQSESSAGSALSAGSSDPAQLSSLREPGAKRNWPSGSSGCPCGGGCGSGSCRWHPRQTVLPGGGRGGRGSLPPQGLGPASRGHYEGSGGSTGHSLQHVPWAPRSLLVCGWMNWSTLGGRPGFTLTSLST